MKSLSLTFLLSMLCFPLHAQQTNQGEFSPLMERLATFSSALPQEKVYIHMDNTSYFMGDTIWFKAYLRQTSDDRPSQVSSVLYAELLNHDGYLMERKIIEMTNGEGDGFFYLMPDSSMYSGFYELRAYTRWQLNWGQHQHEHWKTGTRKWFFNKATEYEFFRDYDKLYSRVFPVYDHPLSAGEYELDMTLRPLQRYYSTDKSETKVELSLFPEGGNLVAGVPNRVAFEATRPDGRYVKGSLRVEGETAQTTNRGRGMFTIVPEAGKEYEVTFTTTERQTAKVRLPMAEMQGVALSVRQEGDNTLIEVHLAGLSADSLALTVMHEGKVEEFKTLNVIWAAGDGKNLEDPSGRYARLRMTIPSSKLPCGVNQVTVFDALGRVYADRLFFVAKAEEMQPTLAVSSEKEEYGPYEQINLNLQSRAKDASLSLAVRDALRHERNYDTGDILTEMLLASEIRGFVPNPQWFFEKDDEEHREALDLLMMTQGWRRYNWKEMAVEGHFGLTHPAEKRITLTGAVHTYRPVERDNPIAEKDLRKHYQIMGMPKDLIEDMIRQVYGRSGDRGDRIFRGKDLKRPKKKGGKEEPWRESLFVDGENLKREVKVHGGMPVLGAYSETATKDGQFILELPRFYGRTALFLMANDTTKSYDRRHYIWQPLHENEYPDFYVRQSLPYPHFVKPYDFYHMLRMPHKEEATSTDDLMSSLEGRIMKQLQVRGKYRGKLRRMYSRPIIKMDVYDAFNMVADAGLMDGWFNSSNVLTTAIARYYVSSMGMKRNYNVQKLWAENTNEAGTQLLNYSSKPREVVEMRGNKLSSLDKLWIYTDYSPRLEGDKCYSQSNQPDVDVAFFFMPDGTARPAYGDRAIRQPGFAYPAEFYSPDYSKQKPAEPTDYRRTLYWNPNVKLDAEGRARVTLYNNSRSTQISISAAGQAQDGTLLWNKAGE